MLHVLLVLQRAWWQRHNGRVVPVAICRRVQARGLCVVVWVLMPKIMFRARHDGDGTRARVLDDSESNDAAEEMDGIPNLHHMYMKPAQCTRAISNAGVGTFGDLLPLTALFVSWR